MAHETWRAGGDKLCDKVRGGEIRREDPIQLFYTSFNWVTEVRGSVINTR